MVHVVQVVHDEIYFSLLLGPPTHQPSPATEDLSMPSELTVIAAISNPMYT